MTTTRYRIRRSYKQDCSRLVEGKAGLTLEQATAHCKDPETASNTCTRQMGQDHTFRYGEWFDGYEVDPG